MKRPSTYWPYHGDSRSPPSPWPAPEILKSAPKWKLASSSNSAEVAPPSSEKLQLWRFANPRQSGSITFEVEIEAGSFVWEENVDSGQSFKGRVWSVAPFAAGVAN